MSSTYLLVFCFVGLQLAGKATLKAVIVVVFLIVVVMHITNDICFCICKYIQFLNIY